ncbi:19344_t:CDS:2, partial [Racocetra persica]
DSMLTHNILHFATVLLKALPDTASIPNIKNKNIHNERVTRYDIRIEQRKEDQSIDNTKLVELKEEALHSLNVRRAVNHRIKFGNSSGIPEQ